MHQISAHWSVICDDALFVASGGTAKAVNVRPNSPQWKKM